MEQRRGLSVLWQLCWPQNLGEGWVGKPRVLRVCREGFFGPHKKAGGTSASHTGTLCSHPSASSLVELGREGELRGKTRR